VLAVFESHRIRQGVGKTELARKAGYSQRIYGDWARGDITNPTLCSVLDYAAALGLQLLIGRQP
jgi:transcriptional regulator with XRE-family HTH domain